MSRWRGAQRRRCHRLTFSFIFRLGAVFPSWLVQHELETEGFGGELAPRRHF